MSTPPRFREHMDAAEAAQQRADDLADARAQVDPGDTWAELMDSAEREGGR